VFKGFGTSRHVQSRLAALDALRTKVMITDAKLNIIYANPATMALMKDAEAAVGVFWGFWPRYTPATMIGSNIDIFHKAPAHQRRMLAGLRKPHAATIHIGTRAFDLLVIPLMQDGRPNGFAVEWLEAEDRLLSADYANQIAAISRTQIVVAYTLDGKLIDANKIFLDLMGYTLEDLRWKSHSLFIESGAAAAAEEVALWDDLRQGRYRAGQFRRMTHDGRIVWLEGAYNPILDADGKLCKIVKFATDVTAQRTLLADLKDLIDENFGEIDGAIGLSTQEANAAAIAVGETSANVQSVAASADQLAASIAEISQSMATSRAATDSAFDRAMAVGKSTETLASAAQAMNGIVRLIRNVASQINLLALNATIEAARAGEAGKGFAVVASEVKNLAIQAARATEQISTEIVGIQTTSAEVAGALGAIRDAVTTVRESVTLTAAAVEEQSAVTRDMSANMQSASGSVGTVSSSITEITSAVLQAASAVAKTKQAAQVLVQ
jgi:PAS domain S-box-containing protein